RHRRARDRPAVRAEPRVGHHAGAGHARRGPGPARQAGAASGRRRARVRLRARRSAAARFAVTMAGRESRASLGRLWLLTASVSLGVAALVAINSFTDDL